MREITKKEQPVVVKKRKLPPPEPKLEWSETVVKQVDEYLNTSPALKNIHSDLLSVPLPRLQEYGTPLGRWSYYLELGFSCFFFIGALLFLSKASSAYIFNLNLWRILLFFSVVIIGLNIRILYTTDPATVLDVYTGTYLLKNTVLLLSNIIGYLYVAHSKRIKATYIYG